MDSIVDAIATVIFFITILTMGYVVFVGFSDPFYG